MKYKYTLLYLLLFLTSCFQKQKNIVLIADKIDGLSNTPIIQINNIYSGMVNITPNAFYDEIIIKTGNNAFLKIPKDSKFVISDYNSLENKLFLSIKYGTSKDFLKSGDTLLWGDGATTKVLEQKLMKGSFKFIENGIEHQVD